MIVMMMMIVIMMYILMISKLITFYVTSFKINLKNKYIKIIKWLIIHKKYLQFIFLIKKFI